MVNDIVCGNKLFPLGHLLSNMCKQHPCNNITERSEPFRPYFLFSVVSSKKNFIILSFSFFFSSSYYFSFCATQQLKVNLLTGILRTGSPCTFSFISSRTPFPLFPYLKHSLVCALNFKIRGRITSLLARTKYFADPPLIF